MEKTKTGSIPEAIRSSDEVAAEQLRANVRDKYGKVALTAATKVQTESVSTPDSLETDCGSGCCSAESTLDPVTTNLYSEIEMGCLPQEAVLASMGCGNPTALASLSEGEVVLDLGSGGGIDVLLSARQVGPSGKAYGLDMTDEMIALARENQAKVGADNVEFLKGEIESIPLPDRSVDVIISNCVINLSVDKPKVLAEAFRVLKPGGCLAVSDIVVRGSVDSRIRASVELWMGCVAGALAEKQYRSYLIDAGFDQIEIEPTRIYDLADARELFSSLGKDAHEIAQAAAGKFMSAFVRAQRPVRETEL